MLQLSRFAGYVEHPRFLHLGCHRLGGRCVALISVAPLGIRKGDSSSWLNLPSLRHWWWRPIFWPQSHKQDHYVRWAGLVAKFVFVSREQAGANEGFLRAGHSWWSDHVIPKSRVEGTIDDWSMGVNHPQSSDWHLPEAHQAGSAIGTQARGSNMRLVSFSTGYTVYPINTHAFTAILLASLAAKCLGRGEHYYQHSHTVMESGFWSFF